MSVKYPTGRSRLEHLAHVANRFGLTVWQWLGHTSPVSGHAAGSYHYQTYPGSNTGRAFDAYGPTYRMRAFAWWLRLRHKAWLTEGIFSDGLYGHNLSVKYGSNVSADYWGSATWAGHKNHVHVAI